MNWRSISALVCVIYISVCIAENYDEDEKYETALRMIEQMAETRKGLSALKQVIDSIDGDLQKTHVEKSLESPPAENRGKRGKWSPSCVIGAGMPGYQCHLGSLVEERNAKNWLSSSRISPGKRRVMAIKVKDLTTKRKGLDVLKRILKEMDADLVMEQKRTCQVNLGGHCATESAASVADQWHYLNSPLSPGRKRRDTTLYKKLVGGRLLQ